MQRILSLKKVSNHKGKKSARNQNCRRASKSRFAGVQRGRRDAVFFFPSAVLRKEATTNIPGVGHSFREVLSHGLRQEEVEQPGDQRAAAEDEHHDPRFLFSLEKSLNCSQRSRFGNRMEAARLIVAPIKTGEFSVFEMPKCP